MKKSYEDIINLPHHQSKTHPHMSVYDRAAQFSPFAALTGYDDEVRETARLTDRRMELSEEAKTELNEKLSLLQEVIGQQPVIQVTYFVPDERKTGGSYKTQKAAIKRIDVYEHALILQKQEKIPIDEIVEITGELFTEKENIQW